MLEAFEILEFDELRSTQDYAKELLKQGHLKHGHVIYTNNQIAGYGRNKRVWISLKGDIAITIAIHLDKPIELWPQLSYTTGVSILQAIQSYDKSLNIKLKWVNDILVKTKKVAGILVEKQQYNLLLIGIGINIKHNNKLEKFNATSLEDCKIKIEQREFLDRMLSSFKKYYNLWLAFEFAHIRNLWLEKAYGIGQNTTVHFADGKQLEGILLDISETGEAVLLSNNQIKTVNAGEIYL